MNAIKFNPQIDKKYTYRITETNDFMKRSGARTLEAYGNSITSLTFQIDSKISSGYSITATINSFSLDAIADMFVDNRRIHNNDEDEDGFVPDLTDKSVQLGINNFGEIHSISGYEHLEKHIAASYNSYLSALSGGQGKLGSAYSETYFRELFADCLYSCDGISFVSGAQWSRKFQFELGSAVKTSNDYKLDQFKDGSVYISGLSTGTIEQEPFRDSNFRVSHKLTLSESTGMFLTSEVDLLISVVLPGKYKMPFEVHRTKKIHLVKAS